MGKTIVGKTLKLWKENYDWEKWLPAPGVTETRPTPVTLLGPSPFAPKLAETSRGVLPCKIPAPITAPMHWKAEFRQSHIDILQIDAWDRLCDWQHLLNQKFRTNLNDNIKKRWYKRQLTPNHETNWDRWVEVACKKELLQNVFEIVSSWCV